MFLIFIIEILQIHPKKTYDLFLYVSDGSYNGGKLYCPLPSFNMNFPIILAELSVILGDVNGNKAC